MTIGAVIMIFIVAVVGLVLVPAIATNQQAVSNTVDSANTTTITVPASGGVVDLSGSAILNTPVVYNTSSGIVVDAGNYTIEERVSTSTALKTIVYIADSGEYEGQTISIDYEYGTDGYAEESGTRSISTLILIFFVLAIVLGVLSPVIKQKFMS
jgi:hypothetical protein